MIKIHKTLWVVKGAARKVEDSLQLLSYMTHQELTKDGKETKSFTSRRGTGERWARCGGTWVDGKYVKSEDPLVKLTFENEPAEGFTIVGSASRWSTSNVVIRVEDPRGFVVEIPTDNLTTLMKHTTVEKCVVKGKCVWGREGNNHIILPVNSEVYKLAANQTKQHNERVSFAKLNAGDVVKFSADDKHEFVYVGRGKAIWEVVTKQAVTNSNYNWNQYYRYTRGDADKVLSTKEVEDSKLCFIFKRTVESGNSWQPTFEYKLAGKCVVKGKSAVPKVKLFDISIPTRLIAYNGPVDFRYGTNSDGTYFEVKTIGIDMKGEANAR